LEKITQIIGRMTKFEIEKEIIIYGSYIQKLNFNNENYELNYNEES